MVKKKTECHRCYDCNKAYLMRSSEHNPVVAECEIDNRRNVASTVMPCEYFVQRTSVVVINKMKKIRT